MPTILTPTPTANQPTVPAALAALLTPLKRMASPLEDVSFVELIRGPRLHAWGFELEATGETMIGISPVRDFSPRYYDRVELKAALEAAPAASGRAGFVAALAGCVEVRALERCFLLVNVATTLSGGKPWFVTLFSSGRAVALSLHTREMHEFGSTAALEHIFGVDLSSIDGT